MWVLLGIPPLLTVQPYASGYVLYRTVTPAQYDTYGTPPQILSSLLPGLALYEAGSRFVFDGVAVLVILGAIVAGGDWERGTLMTSLLQAPGRLSTVAGQLLALVIAIAISVVGTIGVAVGAGVLIVAVSPEAKQFYPTAALMPAAPQLMRAFAVFLLISITFAAAGVVLGILLRSVGAAIAVALLWSELLYPVLYNIGLEAGGPMRALLDALPDTAADSLTSSFGENAGGIPNSMYYPVNPTLSAVILLGYLLLLVLTAAVVLRRRDIAVATGFIRPPSPGWLRHLRTAVRRPATSTPAVPADLRPGGLLTSVRAELYLLVKWPAAWAFILIVPVYGLLQNYVVQYIVYRHADTGVFAGLSSSHILQTMLPNHVATVALNTFGNTSGADGTAPFLLLGAMVTGSDWGRRTIATALLQGPTRIRTAVGQLIAVLLAVATSVGLTLVLSVAGSGAVALTETGSFNPTSGPWPSASTLLSACAAASAVAATYALAGMTLGALFRSSGIAIGVALLWSRVIRVTLDDIGQQLHGTSQTVLNLLPDAPTTALTQLFGLADPLGHDATSTTNLAPMTAAAIIVGYLAIFSAVPVALTRHRDIA